jgi:hypothetical protein
MSDFAGGRGQPRRSKCEPLQTRSFPPGRQRRPGAPERARINGSRAASCLRALYGDGRYLLRTRRRAGRSDDSAIRAEPACLHDRCCRRRSVRGESCERWSQSLGKHLKQVCVRETNESEPSEDASLRTQMSSKPEAWGALLRDIAACGYRRREITRQVCSLTGSNRNEA